MSEKVNIMFSNISKKYDLMNDVLSLGIHRIWKKKFIKKLKLTNSSKVIDIASGSGDLVFEIKKYTDSVIGTDYNKDMLEIAKQRAKKKNLDVEFAIADAMNLQFNDNSFDYATISFGIRNVDDVDKCLKEMARVVKPNGKVAIMEFGQPKGIIGFLYKVYSKYFIPFFGKLLTGDRDSYTYLPLTAAKFPADEAFIKLMNNTNLYSDTEKYKLSFGIAYMYYGIVK